MANVIVNRVKEFLKAFPPFNFLKEEELLEVSRHVEVMYYAKGETLFMEGEPAQPHFFVIKEGSVQLTKISTAGESVKEVCDEGDVFGVLALLGRRPYILTATASEDTLVYAIPVEVFDHILEANSKVSLYFAAGFASGQVVVRTDLSASQKARSAFAAPSQDYGLMIFSGQSDYKFSKNVLTCPRGTTIREAATLMAEKDVGSIVIVNSDMHPQGIITDKDFRKRVISEGKSYEVKVEDLMTSPVLTMSMDSDFPTLYLTMIKNRLHHLIFTEDGTINSAITGIISDHDILLSQGNSPAVLIQALIQATEVKEMATVRDKAEKLLQYYLENELSIDFIASIITEINDIIIHKAIEMAKNKNREVSSEISKVKFCFLSMGSEGREEQLLRTDLDNAIVYEDVPPHLAKDTEKYMLQLAQDVIDTLLACGFSPCPGEIMANNPKWCKPLAVWKQYFSEWIIRPDQKALMHATIFFDFRPIYGAKYLSDQMTDHIYKMIGDKKVFLNFLAKNAMLNPPPLGFFRNFIVEKSGEHKEKLDIKLRAMMPLSDIGRILILSHQVVAINNTFKRFEKLAELEPNHKDLMIEAGKAYEILMRIRASEGLKSNNSGRYIDPSSLGKLQRQLLKNTFAPIDELQKILHVRFQLDFFS
jgi:CBS domain-containing protein